MFVHTNLLIEILLFFWILLQFPAAIVISSQCIVCFDDYKEKRALLFWPLLISSLREKLNAAGTIIATVFISIFFAPAVMAYFVVGSLVGVVYLGCVGFIKLFRRKN